MRNRYQDNSDEVITIMSCPHCGRQLKVTCWIEPGFADFEHAYCVYCGEDLGEFRCDYGSPTVKGGEQA